MTYTTATLEVSAAAFDEIVIKLRRAGYGQMRANGEFDMHGIALSRALPADAEPVAWRHWWRESPGCEVGIVMALENPPANNSSEFPHYVSRSAKYVRSEPLYTVQIWHSDASPPSPDRTQEQEHRPELLPVDWRDFPSNNADMVSFVEHRCMAHYLKGRTDGIAHVAAQADALAALWTPCAEKLPQGNEQYLCWQLLNDGGSYESISGDFLRRYHKQLHITHWTIMPAPPAEARRVTATGEKHDS